MTTDEQADGVTSARRVPRGIQLVVVLVVVCCSFLSLYPVNLIFLVPVSVAAVVVGAFARHRQAPALLIDIAGWGGLLVAAVIGTVAYTAIHEDDGRRVPPNAEATGEQRDRAEAAVAEYVRIAYRAPDPSALVSHTSEPAPDVVARCWPHPVARVPDRISVGVVPPASALAPLEVVASISMGDRVVEVVLHLVDTRWTVVRQSGDALAGCPLGIPPP